MKIVLCIERFTVNVKMGTTANSFTFREGEAYMANNVNEHYWVVDSIGIKTEDFALHFEIQEEVVEREKKINDEVNKRFVEEETIFEEFLENFGEDETLKKEEKYPWYVRWTSSFILWQNYEQ